MFLAFQYFLRRLLSYQDMPFPEKAHRMGAYAFLMIDKVHFFSGDIKFYAGRVVGTHTTSHWEAKGNKCL